MTIKIFMGILSFSFCQLPTLRAGRGIGNVSAVPLGPVKPQQVGVLTGIGVGLLGGTRSFKPSGSAIVQAFACHAARLAYRGTAKGRVLSGFQLLPGSFIPDFKGANGIIPIHGNAGLHFSVPVDGAAGT